MSRVSLVDPLLYQSSYVNPHPTKPIILRFWQKFNFLNCFFNLLLPLFVLIFILFMLKQRYWSKLEKSHSKDMLHVDQSSGIKLKPNGMGYL